MTKVLVIEDEQSIRENLLDLLESENFETLAAANGKIGIQLALEQLPDVILCDVMMPELDGHDVISELRKTPATANIPFIFLTAKGERTDLREGMNLGADDYLVKPFTPDELLTALSARLKRFLQQNEQLKQVEQQLETLENFDRLTGLPNSSALGEYLSQADARRNNSQSLVPFLILGLDRFSRVNEVIGYEEGDLILQEVGDRLVDFGKNYDLLAIVRLEGDEFALIFPPISDENEISNITDNLLKVIAKPFWVAGKSLVLTSSIGIAFYPLAKNLEELRKQASTAISQAKESGGNNCQIYRRPLFGLDADKELKLLTQFHEAWQNKKLEVRYQPRIDLKKNRLVGVAATVGWKHPWRGEISPGKIIELATEAGLIVSLTEWLLEKACQEVAKWRESKFFLQLAVSLPEQLFAANNLQEIVTNILVKTNLIPGILELEITAKTIENTKNLNALALKLMELRRLGINITIAQLNMASGCLQDLGDLPINGVKIDANSIGSLPQNAPLVKAMVEVARNLKMRAIAEGVENQEQIIMLKKQKCHEIQKKSALTAAEVKKLLEKNKLFKLN
ncbi:MAG: EAL domain-containing protein [Kamptonema sp. SIO1D9]|nr:EAL domain-containing protein [Kamptonema sp. SIO1D9]